MSPAISLFFFCLLLSREFEEVNVFLERDFRRFQKEDLVFMRRRK